MGHIGKKVKTKSLRDLQMVQRQVLEVDRGEKREHQQVFLLFCPLRMSASCLGLKS